MSSIAMTQFFGDFNSREQIDAYHTDDGILSLWNIYDFPVYMTGQSVHCARSLFFIQPLNPNPDSNWGAFFKDNDMLLQIDKDCRWVDQESSIIHGCNYMYIESWQAN